MMIGPNATDHPTRNTGAAIKLRMTNGGKMGIDTVTEKGIERMEMMSTAPPKGVTNAIIVFTDVLALDHLLEE